jgi:DNA-binding MarR family transcriptional regulator
MVIADVRAAFVCFMPMSRPKEPQKKKPNRPRRALMEGENPVEDVMVAARRVGFALESHLGQFFQRFGITARQFTVLRIVYVRDAAWEGLPTAEIQARMVGRAPDLPRLLERLAKSGLIERTRSDQDRRVVRLKLTPKGFDLVERVHEPLLASNKPLLAHMSAAELQVLAKGLRRMLEGELTRTESKQNATESKPSKRG